MPGPSQRSAEKNLPRCRMLAGRSRPNCVQRLQARFPRARVLSSLGMTGNGNNIAPDSVPRLRCGRWRS